jgi:hypothetical protein
VESRGYPSFGQIVLCFAIIVLLFRFQPRIPILEKHQQESVWEMNKNFSVDIPDLLEKARNHQGTEKREERTRLYQL